MLNVEKTATEIHEAIEALADDKRRQATENNAPTAMRVLGVTAPKLHSLLKGWVKDLRNQPPKTVITLTSALVNAGTLEGRMAGCLLLHDHKKALAALDLKTVLAFGEGIDNWVSVDTFAELIAGMCWRAGILSDETIHEWTHSDNRWWRRAAVVATVSLNKKARGATGDPARTLKVCALVADDHDDMVVKALSWALRELAKRDSEPVIAFLKEHDHSLHPRVKREVRTKIETGLKSG